MTAHLLKTVLIVALIHSWTSLLGQQPEAASETSDLFKTSLEKEVESVVATFQQQHKVPGLSVAIHQKGNFLITDTGTW